MRRPYVCARCAGLARASSLAGVQPRTDACVPSRYTWRWTAQAGWCPAATSAPRASMVAMPRSSGSAKGGLEVRCLPVLLGLRRTPHGDGASPFWLEIEGPRRQLTSNGSLSNRGSGSCRAKNGFGGPRPPVASLVVGREGLSDGALSIWPARRPFRWARPGTGPNLSPCFSRLSHARARRGRGESRWVVRRPYVAGHRDLRWDETKSERPPAACLRV